MKHTNQQERRQQIESAAYEILADKGYKAASMLAIAKRALASNETLYKWYGSKQNLFASLVDTNAQSAKQALSENVDTDVDPIGTLRNVGPKLLRLVTGEKAVVLNRAAVGDFYETGELGKTIAMGGREAVVPLLAGLFERARNLGLLKFDSASEIATVYVSLLIGDLQIQRVIGAHDELKPKQIRDRAALAERLIIQLYGTAKLRRLE